ncbi:hypothetical protein M8J75_003857 [Diaphorina citri]|nr:hypothetical protein M8J75_003857 [Diaphorina citri]
MYTRPLQTQLIRLNLNKCISHLTLSSQRTYSAKSNDDFKILQVPEKIKKRRDTLPGIENRKEYLKDFSESGSVYQNENEAISPDVDADEFHAMRANFMDLDKSYELHEREKLLRRRVKEKAAIKKKHFKEAKQPALLTITEIYQIKLLHEQEPSEWTPQKLSLSFPATPSVILRVLKNDTYRTAQQMLEHDMRVKHNWALLQGGQLEGLSPDYQEHLASFSFRDPIVRSLEDYKKFQPPVYKYVPENTEFRSIITNYYDLVKLRKQKLQDSLSNDTSEISNPTKQLGEPDRLLNQPESQTRQQPLGDTSEQHLNQTSEQHLNPTSEQHLNETYGKHMNETYEKHLNEIYEKHLLENSEQMSDLQASEISSQKSNQVTQQSSDLQAEALDSQNEFQSTRSSNNTIKKMEIKSPNTPSEFPGISSATVKKLDTCLSIDKASLWGLHHAKRSSSHSASDGSQTERQDQSEDTNRSEVSRKLETDHSNQIPNDVSNQGTDDWKKLGEFSQDRREEIENKSNEDASESNQPSDVNEDRPNFDLNRTMHTRKPAYAAEIERQRYQAEMEKKRNEAEARADRASFDGKWRRLKPNQGSVSDQYSETQSDNFERNDRPGLRNDRPSLRNDRAQLGHHRPSLDSEEFDPEWDENEDGRYHYKEEDSTRVNTTQAENSIHTSSNTESSDGVARPFDKNRTMYPTKPPHWQEVTRKKMISDKEKQYNMDEMNVAFTDRSMYDGKWRRLKPRTQKVENLEDRYHEESA